MSNKTLSQILKSVVVFLVILGIGIYGGLIPFGLSELVKEYQDFNALFLPWLIFLSLSSLPIFAILGLGYVLSNEIGKDNSFSRKNVKCLKGVSILLIVEAVYFFVGNLMLWFCNLNYPVVVLLSLALSFFAVAIAAVINVLAHLVKKAVDLREENETII